MSSITTLENPDSTMKRTPPKFSAPSIWGSQNETNEVEPQWAICTAVPGSRATQINRLPVSMRINAYGHKFGDDCYASLLWQQMTKLNSNIQEE